MDDEQERRTTLAWPAWSRSQLEQVEQQKQQQRRPWRQRPLSTSLRAPQITQSGPIYSPHNNHDHQHDRQLPQRLRPASSSEPLVARNVGRSRTRARRRTRQAAGARQVGPQERGPSWLNMELELGSPPPAPAVIEHHHQRRARSRAARSALPAVLRECLFSKLLLLVCLAALFTTSQQQQQQRLTQELNSFTHRPGLTGAGLEQGRRQQQQPEKAHQAANYSSALHSASAAATSAPSPATTTTTTTTASLATSSIKEANLSSTSKRALAGQRRAEVASGADEPAARQHDHHHNQPHSDAQWSSEVESVLGAKSTAARQLSKRALSGPGASGTWKQQQLLQQQEQYLLSRITEADLLPLADFTVEQPAFSDIMRSWPPTTTRQLLQSTWGGGGGAKSAARGAGQRGRHRPDQQANFGQRAPSSSSSGAGGSRRPATGSGGSAASFFERLTSFQDSSGADEPAGWVRNHLNEDLDDTILTADESFEQDQLAEPPTWVNYLGELGDLIYLQLRNFYDSSTRSPFAASTAPAPAPAPPTSPSSTAQMAAANRSQQQVRFEAIEDLLDDFYYDQYENNQVLYYGPQLVREGDTFEIGCYLPNEQPAEWTKSGKPLVLSGGAVGDSASGANSAGANASSSASYARNPASDWRRHTRRADFLGAKQNFSLKVYEAEPGDGGSYRCNRLSRKYHKLIVVPARVSVQQLYLIQQKLLSIVAPAEVSGELSAQQIQLAALQAGWRAGPRAQRPTIQASGDSLEPAGRPARRGNNQTGSGLQMATTNQGAARASSLASAQLLPGHVLVEGQPMIVSCNITDEFILRRLRELPHFQLAWYKNGRLLRNSQPNSPAANSSGAQSSPAGGFHTSSGLVRQQQQQQQSAADSHNQQQHQQQHQQQASRPPGAASQRVQFVGPNGRQMYIISANYADAGDYLCSWSRLPTRQDGADSESADSEAEQDSSATSAGQPSAPAGPKALNANLLAAGNLHQLVAPVKLRPFKSAYQVRARNQLRLVCQVQRGYPAAQISWYVGNQLVDGHFLRANPEFRLLQLEPRAPNSKLQLQLRASGQFEGDLGEGAQPPAAAGAAAESSNSSPTLSEDPDEAPKMVEINPIPAGRQQMQLTANGRGQWIEYRKLGAQDKYSIETADSQLRYLQMKLGQLTGASVLQASAGAEQQPQSGANSPLGSQASLSVLVVNNLQASKHTSRYACRATSRANTDEVTTVIRVKDLATNVIKPHGGAATLIPGQPLHFECSRIEHKHAEFKWYKRTLTEANARDDPYEEPRAVQDQRTLLEPNTDDNIEIHNERLTLLKPGYDSIGDYICQSLDNVKNEMEREFGVIKLRAPPYIDDFGLEALSHTGKSASVSEGQRLVMTCQVRDRTVPVSISWVRSELADDDRHMTKLAEIEAGQAAAAAASAPSTSSSRDELLAPTYQSASEVIVERVDNFTKRLVIESVGPEHRGYYGCVVDNGVTERSQKTVFIRVKDNIVALWPFLGILAELFILFTIIYVWETQRAQKAILAPATTTASSSSSSSNNNNNSNKRPPSGPTSAFENVPLNR